MLGCVPPLSNGGAGVQEELVELILSQQPSPAEAPDGDAPDGDAPSPAFDVDASDQTPVADLPDRTPDDGPPDDDASERDRDGDQVGHDATLAIPPFIS